MTIHAHLFAIFPDFLLDANQITVGDLDRDYVTFVELSDMTEEKVQIRIADAKFPGAPGVRPAGFTPTIIWESPLQWDLCE